MNIDALKKKFPNASKAFLEANSDNPKKVKGVNTDFRVELNPEPGCVSRATSREYRDWLKKVVLESNPVSFGDMNLIDFTVMVAPMGAPRMTRRDKWKKRPIVLRYHEYRDILRNAMSSHCKGELPPVPVRCDLEFYYPMPDSWSEKKKNELYGKPHRQRPDKDNCEKAVLDALFPQDGGIAEGYTQKRWCRQGQERVRITLYL